ncbi:MAG: hypothetical protein NT023_10380 [Armatimonadetes bacterium]|nr:hypothetical protein [Armatimonadota bacterium]
MPSPGKPSYRDLASPRGDNAYCKDYGSRWTRLQRAGCKRVYVDGSFATAKPEPGDFDACWDITDVTPETFEPALLDFTQGRAAHKRRYGGELFPAQLPEGESGRAFLDFFQTDKTTGHRKGILLLDLTGL